MDTPLLQPRFAPSPGHRAARDDTAFHVRFSLTFMALLVYTARVSYQPYRRCLCWRYTGYLMPVHT